MVLRGLARASFSYDIMSSVWYCSGHNPGMWVNKDSAFFCLKVFLGAKQGMDLPSRVWSAETLDFGIHSAEGGLGMATLDERTSEELQAELLRLQDCSFNLFVHVARAQA